MKRKFRLLYSAKQYLTIASLTTFTVLSSASYAISPYATFSFYACELSPHCQVNYDRIEMTFTVIGVLIALALAMLLSALLIIWLKELFIVFKSRISK